MSGSSSIAGASLPPPPSDPPKPPIATTTTGTASSASARRNTPYLPTPLETALLAIYPLLLVFGSLFALVSPQTRRAPFDAHSQSHPQDPSLAPSYFARKDNVFNVMFVKRGWFWVTFAFFAFVASQRLSSQSQSSHSSGSGQEAERKERTQKLRYGVRAATTRWALITAWWVLVTQWCFGPALIDRGFRFTGGKCEAVEARVFEEGVANAGGVEVFSAAACRAVGGKWRGGHDISGHVFLLVLGSFFLVQEVGWVLFRGMDLSVNGLSGGGGGTPKWDPRALVMHDGAVKSADVESDHDDHDHLLRHRGGIHDMLGVGGKIAGVVVGLSLWMLLMTAIYFHTWFEKLTGLLVALVGLYAVYILPRWIPAVRTVVGLPGL